MFPFDAVIMRYIATFANAHNLDLGGTEYIRVEWIVAVILSRYGWLTNKSPLVQLMISIVQTQCISLNNGGPLHCLHMHKHASVNWYLTECLAKQTTYSNENIDDNYLFHLTSHPWLHGKNTYLALELYDDSINAIRAVKYKTVCCYVDTIASSN